MKKLFALVLTLALVFAIAAPAMAASWGAGTPSTGSPFAVAVTQLQSNTDAAGNNYYTAYPANLGVVAGSTVIFQVSFTVPTDDDLEAYYADPTTAGVLDCSISLKNLGSLKVLGEYIDGEKQTAETLIELDNGAIDKLKVPMANATDDAIVYSIILSGVVTKTAEAIVTGTMGYSAAKALPFNKTVGGVTYTFNADTATGTDIQTDTSSLTFTKTKDVVTGWTLNFGGEDYTVLPGPVFQYVNDANKIAYLTAADGYTYTQVLATYNAYVALLGFQAGDAGIYYTEANIKTNLGYSNKATDTKSYKPYTSSLTVSDGTTVPNTGDAVSVLGFVMVGLALLATAAVVVKKVRA